VSASRSAVTDTAVSMLKDVGEITGTALGVVTDPVRGAHQGNKEVGAVEAEQAPRSSLVVRQFVTLKR